MRIPESDWRVDLVLNEDGAKDWTSEIVEAQTEKDAEEKALSEYGDGWQARGATRLCDFCKPASHDRVEAYTQVTVVDESDIMDAPPGEFEAPKRCAWVCINHYEVVKDLPTYRAAPEASK